ncbi:MAG: hypothetical protein HY433_01760 [Candidatus Liptonbacteria bacterium]|nr:hypothetical protein [Candidatus Liptonbacteria bacterium]
MSETQKTSRLGGLLITSTSAWGFVWFVNGNLVGWMENSLCFKYLGCNVGFFGYDALVHFLAGIMEAVFILWLAKKFPKFDFFSQPNTDSPLTEKNFLKNAVTLIALVALLSIGWEFLEFGYDQARINVFHHDLLYPTNSLRQAGNADTMGDLFFSLLGAAIMTVAPKFFDKKRLTANADNLENI